jgi:hypothetical protein
MGSISQAHTAPQSSAQLTADNQLQLSAIAVKHLQNAEKKKNMCQITNNTITSETVCKTQ